MGVVEWGFCGGVVGEDLWQNNPSPMVSNTCRREARCAGWRQAKWKPPVRLYPHGQLLGCFKIVPCRKSLHSRQLCFFDPIELV
jgi:hypothetical protein